MMHLPSCRGLAKNMEKIKQSLWSDFSGGSEVRRHWVRLALNEAEALAWLTPFPDLLFPALAEEKARKLSFWADRQQTLLRPKTSSHARLT